MDTPDNITSLLDVQTKKVNEYCGNIREMELSQLTGTEFEKYGYFLKKAWVCFFGYLGEGEEETLPTFSVSTKGTRLKLYSSLCSVQFTSKKLPTILADLKVELKCGIEWRIEKGDGNCVPKEVNDETNGELRPDLGEQCGLVAKDILGDEFSESTPIHLIHLLVMLVGYMYTVNQTYVGTERNFIDPELDKPVIKVVFSNGLKSNHIFIDLDSIREDWEDFSSRLKDHTLQLQEQN